ncbi:hypothetical protein FACS1894184_05830 [Clostridia bacterium]|nr:hypothetical protein FACS1894184_05830 [Clostridia bacterium]
MTHDKDVIQPLQLKVIPPANLSFKENTVYNPELEHVDNASDSCHSQSSPLYSSLSETELAFETFCLNLPQDKRYFACL